MLAGSFKRTRLILSKALAGLFCQHVEKKRRFEQLTDSIENCRLKIEDLRSAFSPSCKIYELEAAGSIMNTKS